jgi:plastocyanin
MPRLGPLTAVFFVALAPVVVQADDEPKSTCTVRGVIETRGRPRGPVVVYVTGEGPPATAETTAVIGQKNKSFDQDAVVVAPGAEVAFPNKDAVHHHLYSHSNQDPFEFPQHAPGARPTRQFDTPGDVRVQCNIHENMETHVLVLPNAWATEAEKGGAFELTGIEPGTRILEAWSAWHRPERMEVECTPGGVHDASATLRMRFPASGPESDSVY